MATQEALDPITGTVTTSPNPGQVYKASLGGLAGVDQSLPVVGKAADAGAQAAISRGQVYRPTMGSVDHSVPKAGG